MSDPINAPALAEHPCEDTKDARLAAFARLKLHTQADIKDFIRNQESVTRSSKHRED